MIWCLVLPALTSIWLLALGGGRWELLHSQAFKTSDGLPDGVTCLQEMARRPSSRIKEDNAVEVFVGTKRGSVKRVTIEHGRVQLEETLGERKEADGVCRSSSPSFLTSSSSLPIYSMAGSCLFDNGGGSSTALFCGGGDRYVSVWEESNSDRGQRAGSSWVMNQRLGPHTGWVKSVLLNPGEKGDDQQEFLHSIGCNCIETWSKETPKAKATGSSGRFDWKHVRKVSVESSPSMGSTLSSDLLCLCPFRDGAFFAGGVDGRIHLWNVNSTIRGKICVEPIASVAAHDGRVNALKYDANMCLLFSGSHDGTICCWSFGDESASSQLFSQHAKSIVSDYGDTRITSLAHVTTADPTSTAEHQQSSTTLVFFGTQKGVLGVVSASARQKGEEVFFSSLSKFVLPYDPAVSVNSLCVVPEPSSTTRVSTTKSKRFKICAGHSGGLNLLTYELHLFS